MEVQDDGAPAKGAANKKHGRGVARVFVCVAMILCGGRGAAQIASPDVLANIRFQKIRGVRGGELNEIADAVTRRGRIYYLGNERLLVADERRPHLIQEELALPAICRGALEIEFVAEADRFYILTENTEFFSFRLKTSGGRLCMEPTTTGTIKLDKRIAEARAFTIDWGRGVVLVPQSGTGRRGQNDLSIREYRFDTERHVKMYYRDKHEAEFAATRRINRPSAAVETMMWSTSGIFLGTTSPNELFTWPGEAPAVSIALPQFAREKRLTGVAEGPSSYYIVCSQPDEVAVIPKLVPARQH